MRRPDWQDRFAAFAKERRDMPFEWGSNDCCTFAAAAVQALTGTNPMAEFTAYGSDRAAARVVAAGGGLSALTSAAMGEPVSPHFAAVGDVVMVKNDGRELLAVCNGTTAISAGGTGIVALDMTAAVAAWKI